MSTAQVQRHRPPGTDDDLARRLRRCRVERAGISQRELAEIMGISPHRVQHAEHANLVLTSDEASAWAHACGCACQSTELRAMAAARQPVAIDLSGSDA